MLDDRDQPSSGAKPLKKARSEAELQAIKQRNVQIVLSILVLAVGIANLLVNVL